MVIATTALSDLFLVNLTCFTYCTSVADSAGFICQKSSFFPLCQYRGDGMNVSRAASDIEHNVPSIACLASRIRLDRLYFFFRVLEFPDHSCTRST